MDKKVIAGILALPASVILGAIVWAHDAHYDDRYILITAYQQSQKDQRIEELEDIIDELTLKKSLGLATEYDKALLEQKEKKLNKLQ